MKAVSASLFAGLVICAFVPLAPAAETATFTEKVLYSFGSLPDGAQPYDSVIDVNGTLYGTTATGGNADYGTVFALDLNTSAEKVLHSFDSTEGVPEAGLIDVKGTLYGTTSGSDGLGGTVFSLDPNTDALATLYYFCSQTNCADGAYPVAGLMRVKGALYGTTLGGGLTGCSGLGCGTVFLLHRKTGVEKMLYLFCSQANCADGRWPSASLIYVNSVLYGTTPYGAVPGCAESIGCGTVFSIDLNTGAEKLLYSFCSQSNCADGATPDAGLIDVNGKLYGTTEYGGGTGCNGLGCGTVFSVDPNTGDEKVLYSFCSQQNCLDGAESVASLADVDGILYGTTIEGGGSGCGGTGCGTVFSIDPNTGVEKVIHSFAGGPSDGAQPRANLIDVNAKLYGTTLGGGAHGDGTVFMLSKR
jgi:uncharacterized repeat protein (TIGR03803 family)